MTAATPGRYDRSCGVRGCPDKSRHDHTGPLVIGEGVVCVVTRATAPVVCYQNAMGHVLTIGAAQVTVELVDNRIVSLQPGDVVRARGWTAPHARATSPVRKEAVTDGTELTIDDALEAT